MKARVDWLERNQQKFPKLKLKLLESAKGPLYVGYCPDHGKFEVVGHLKLFQRKFGCDKCGHQAQADANTKWNTKSLRAHLKKTHGNKYDLSKVEYRGYYEPITMSCKKHGDWKTTVLAQTVAADTGKVGQGCPGCWSERRSKTVNKTELQRVNKLEHKGRYDLSLVPENFDWDAKLPIVCPDHGVVPMTKYTFAGVGCSECAKRHYTVKISGRTLKVQGYERFALPEILADNDLHISQIFEAKHPDKKRRPPRITWYDTETGEKSYHYPDFWVPHLNTVIEIKSKWTAGLLDNSGKNTSKNVLAKKKAAELAGYKYVIFVVERKNGKTLIKAVR